MSNQLMIPPRTGKGLRDCSNKDITAVLIRVWQICGLVPANYPPDINYLCDYLRREYPYFTEEWMVKAFELWAKGTVYSQTIDFRGSFSTLFIEQVIQEFNRYRKAHEPQEQEPEPRTITEAEREQMMKDGCVHAWNEYLRTGKIYDFAGKRYDYLVSTGQLNFATERMMEAEKLAQTMTHATVFGHRPRPANAEIYSINTKNAALKMFFDDLIEVGETIQDRL